jgi:4-amino-4-deoxy-L-arabinose transferase-like glycosyltransferase
MFSRDRLLVAVALCVLLGLGIFLRIFPSSGYHRAGYDEFGYCVFVQQIQKAGLWNYDKVVQVYVERQYRQPDAVVPATRIAFLAPAAVIATIFHLAPFQALHATSAAAGILLLLLSTHFAWRLGGIPSMLGVTALMSCAPLQIYLSQRALIDGYFAFWALLALWLTWENLTRPRHWGWLSAYTICLTILVLTKENAAFVIFALFGLLLLNRFLSIGTLTPQLLVATVLGPALGVLLLAALVGGVWEWLEFYRMFVAKSRTNFYSILAQDGPWYRYAVDFVIISPLLVACACGRIFQLHKRDLPGLFMTVFLLLSLLAMSMVKYGISLRYAAFCDLPLAWLASSQVLALGRRIWPQRSAFGATLCFVLLAFVGLNQYQRFFVSAEVYDPTTAALVWASGMEKSPTAVKKVSNSP